MAEWWEVAIPTVAGLAGVAITRGLDIVQDRRRHRAEHEDRLWQRRVDLYLDLLVCLGNRPGERWEPFESDDRELVGLDQIPEPDPLLEARIVAFGSYAVRELWGKVGFERTWWNSPGESNLEGIVRDMETAIEGLRTRMRRELEQHAYAEPKFRRFKP